MRSGGTESQRGGQVSGSGGFLAPDTESEGGANTTMRFFVGIQSHQRTLYASVFLPTDLYAFNSVLFLQH